MNSASSGVRYRLFGSIGSPYALKLRSLLRYKRLPFDWVPATLDWIPGTLPHPPLSAASSKQLERLSPRVVPAVYFPDDATIRNESTSIAYLLDQRCPPRRAIAHDPGVAFLSHLLEDMADEWLVKVAFNQRWGDPVNARYKSRVVTGELLGGNFDQEIQYDAALYFSERQRLRMPLVGCTAENTPLIDEYFHRLLMITNDIFVHSTFLFGDSPLLADFGLYGQLESLATDPTAGNLMREKSTGVFPYLQLLDDSSGIEETTITMSDITPTVAELLRLASEYYLPYLYANKGARMNGESILSIRVHDKTFTQRTFKYHEKCLLVLQKEYASIPPASRSGVDDLLDSVGALRYFSF